jgi:prolyl 4-hydroxylase
MALIQEAYNLNITDLMNGVINIINNEGKLSKYKSDFNITCETMHQIGVTASNRGWHDSAHIWLKMALDQCQDESSTLLSELRDAHRKNIELHDHILETRGTIEHSKTLGRTFAIPLNEKLRKKKKYRKLVKSLTSDISLDLENIPRIRHYIPLFNTNGTAIKLSRNAKRLTRDNFYSMCKDGERKWRTPKINMNLTCRFQHHQNSHLRLGPFLVEEKNIEPFVVLFHNLLSPNEISHLKERGSKGMHRSRMATTTSIKGKGGANPGHAGLTRTSQQGWIVERKYRFPVTDTYTGWDHNGTFHTTEEIVDATCPEYPANVQNHLIVNDIIAHNVTKRIERATKLVLDRPYASESYQVVNYGIGGQYDVHPDMAGYHSYPGEKPSIGDKFKLWYSLVGGRQSTFLMYLSAVDAGGGTVFPMLGLRSNPVAGDALFWNNLNSDGRGDYLSVHGACPIVVGDKWVTNKWIMHYDNFRETPCDLEELQSIKMLNMWKKSTL